MVSLVLSGYLLLWIHAKDRLIGGSELFLKNVVTQLNHDINDHGHIFANSTFAVPKMIKAYQLIVFKPNGDAIKLNSEKELDYFKIPTWTADISQIQTQQNTSFLETWRPLDKDYRLYVYIEFTPILGTFNHPIYILPIILALLFFCLHWVQLYKRYQTLHQLMTYMQRFSKITHSSYEPLYINQNAEPETLQIVQTVNRLTFKSNQYVKKIQQLNQQHNFLIDKSPVALFLINRKGRLLYFNEKFAHTFATPFSKKAVYMLQDFIIGSSKQMQQLLTQITEQSAFLSISVTDLQRKDFFDLRLNPVYNHLGQLQGYSGSLELVTNYHEKLQEAWIEDKQTAEKLAGFDKVWAVLGHELRTPLSGMMGMIELLVEDKNDFNQEHQETITTIQQSSQTMLSLLNDMLDVAKLDAGKLVVNYSSVNILQLCHQVSELMMGNAKRQGISLYIGAHPDVPRFIQTDDGRMRQVILNLMSNAIKFTKQGYVALLIDKLTYEHPVIAHKKAGVPDLAPDWIRITVKDTGMGIPKKEQQKLFSYFNQANDSISQQFGGTGLGLAISNNFSQLLGGFINLESEAGKGSEFQVFLPLQNHSLAPIFNIDIKHLPVFLVIICPFDITYRNHDILDALQVEHLLFTDVNEDMVGQINQAQMNDLLPIFLIDELSYIGNQSIFEQIDDFKKIPKIIMSMETERTIDNDIMVDFDDLLQKPPSAVNLFAKVLKIYEERLNPEKQTKLSAELAFKKFLQKHNLESTEACQEAMKKQILTEKVKPAGQERLVLVADDNAVNQKIAQKSLQALGYNCILANDGEEAIQLLHENRDKIAMILMDCQMPVMDGLTATRHIRKQKDSVIIVALTANDSDEDRKLCHDAGMDAFMTKPVSKTKLAELFTKFMI